MALFCVPPRRAMSGFRGSSQPIDATPSSYWIRGWQMVTSPILFTAKQKDELWERWKNGQSVSPSCSRTSNSRDQKPRPGRHDRHPPPICSSPLRVAGEILRRTRRYAKSDPGKLNHGASLGVPPHLFGKFVRAKTGIDMPYVPYRSTAAAIPDFLSGQTQATGESVSVMLPHIRAGAARPAGGSTKRLPELPDVPTLVEAGLSGYPDEASDGLVAPAGAPRRSLRG